MKLSPVFRIGAGWHRRRIATLFYYLAFALGLGLTLLSLQFRIDVDVLARSFVAGGTGDSLVVSKRTWSAMALDPSVALFTSGEIADLRAQGFARSVDAVESNTYQADLYMSLGASRYGTEIFFESVPDQTLGPLPDNWGWIPPGAGQSPEEVPILLSRSFLTLYNLGFAPSRGLPAIPPELISRVALVLRVSGPSGSLEIPARFAGLSDRLSSFIVPESFMRWANAGYGKGESQVRRLIVRVDNADSPLLEAYLKSHDLSTEDASQGLRQAHYLVSSITTILSIIGILLLATSLAVFSLNLQVYLSQTRDDLRLLLMLGYSRNRLALASSLSMIVPLVVLCALVLTGSSLLTERFHEILSAQALNLDGALNPVLYLSVFPFLVVLWLACTILVRRRISLWRSTAA